MTFLRLYIIYLLLSKAIIAFAQPLIYADEDNLYFFTVNGGSPKLSATFSPGGFISKAAFLDKLGYALCDRKLYSLDATGKLLLTMDLKNIVKEVPLHPGHLTVSEVVYKGKPSVFLAGILSNTLFVMDVTNVQPQLIWSIPISLDAKPSIVRFATGKWGIILAQGNQISFYHLESPVLFASLSLAGTVSELTVVDSKQASYADFVYAGDNQGNVWEMDIHSEFPAMWKSQKISIREGYVIQGPVVVTRHPQKIGKVIYGVAKFQQQSLLFAYLDQTPLFMKEEKCALSPPRVQQNYLMTSCDNQFKVFDVVSGELLEQKNATSILNFKAQTDPEAPRLCMAKPHDHAPFVLIKSATALGFLQWEMKETYLGLR